MEISEQRQEKDVLEVGKTQLQQQQWRQEEEGVEWGETAVALQERRSRQPSATTVVVNSTGGVNVLFPLSEEPHNGFKKHRLEALQDGDNDGNGLEEDSEAISVKNVYYDKDRGTESVDGFSTAENNAFLFSASERSSRGDGLVAAIENFDDQKSQSHAVNHQTKEISNDGSFSHLGFLPFEQSSEKHQTNKSCSDITVTFDDEQTVEIDCELTEFDVERVLEKQNTHDLYCPNCDSCMTRRVILCRRKRSIWIPEEGKKHNKRQPLGASELDASIVPIQNYQGRNTVDSSLDGSLIPEAHGHHSGLGPEVFGCLSCFSCFIPTGSEFKPFKKLGDKSEKENMQSPRPISEVKKNWFSFLFISLAETVLVAQARILLQQKAVEHILKPVKNGTFEHNQDELKILVHSSTDSLTVEKSCMDEKINVAIKSKPAGYGFKLFKKHWGKSEKENIQSPRPISDVNKNWFSFLFLSVAETVLVAQGSGDMADMENSSVEASKKEIKSPHQTFDGRGVVKETGGDGETEEKLDHVTERGTGTDATVVVQDIPVEPAAAQGIQDIIPSAKTKPFAHGGFLGMDVIRSIVYGGLVESITGLGVVLSAAGADATMSHILALGLANLIGGLFIIGQNLWELKNDYSGSISTETEEDASDQTSKQLERYQELLGQRGKFLLHATFAILSYLIFGLLPPVIYGFSFRESGNRDFKLIAVAASSLLCIILLATGKAYTQRPPRSYIKTIICYVAAGFMASGVSYAVGDLIKKLLEKLGWLSSDSALTLTLPLPLQQQAWRGAYQGH